MDKKLYAELYSKRPKVSKFNLVLCIIVVILFVLSAISIEGPDIPESGMTVVRGILDGLIHPDWSLFYVWDEQNVIYLMIETVAIAFLGTLIGSIFAIIPSFLGAINITGPHVSRITRILLNIIRTVPAIIYGLMFIRVTGPGAFAGVMTFSVTSIGMVSKLYIEAIEELDKGVLEALKASGATRFEQIRVGVFPQIKAQFLSTSIYRFEINIRDAATLGLVGAGGLGTPLILALAESRFEDVGAYILGLIILVIIIEVISSKIRMKLING